MLQKTARFLLAVVLVLAFCPAMAFADDQNADSVPNNPISEFFSAVTRMAEGAAKNQSTFADMPVAPPLVNTLPGLEAAEPLTSGGILLGGGKNYLFYLPEVTFKAADGSTVSAYKGMLVYDFDAGAWGTSYFITFDSAGAPFLEFCSAAIWNDKIYLSGSPMGVDGTMPVPSGSPTSNIYSFDISDESDLSGGWTVEVSNTPVAASLVNGEGNLELIGGLNNGAPSNKTYFFDSENSQLIPGHDIGANVVGAKTVTNDQTLYIYTYGDSLSELRSGSGMPGFYVHHDGETSSAGGNLPAVVQPANMDQYPTQRAVMGASIDTCDDGLVMVGPTAEVGSTDTFQMLWGGSSFSAYSKTAAKEQLSGATAFVYLNNLYVVASVIGEDGQPAMVFRTTPMANVTVLAGNNGVWRLGSTGTLDFRFSPNFGRFSGVAEVDGELISVGLEYEADPGSTIIHLKDEYLNELEVGEYHLTTYYDDRQMSSTARFIIAEGASVIPEEDGVTNPAQLAPTGDLLPVLPLAIVVVAAIVVIAVLLTRRSRSK